DQIGTLAAFQTIDFSGGANTIDAAIALSSADNLANATPADEGYGLPNSAIYGDANGDGVFDDRNSLLGLAVQKYGRTTKATHGQITGINATVNVCYEVFIIFCVKQATFVDQLIIEPGTFSGGGDSGSLIVADDGSNRPVGLLFAGSGTQTLQALGAGAAATLVFPWNTTASSLGTHVLQAQHALADDNVGNNQASASVTLNSVSLIIHVGDLDATTSRSGSSWSATVQI